MLLCTLLVKYSGLLGPSEIVYLTKIVKRAARPDLETDVLPVLRKQNGFKDEITFLAADRAEAVAMLALVEQDPLKQRRVPIVDVDGLVELSAELVFQLVQVSMEGSIPPQQRRPPA